MQLGNFSKLIGLAYGYTTNIVGERKVITTNIVHEQLGDLPKAMTAGPGTGSGFVTIAENNDSHLAGLPVVLHVIQVRGGPFRGDIKVLYPDNVFDERLTLRLERAELLDAFRELEPLYRIIRAVV